MKNEKEFTKIIREIFKDQGYLTHKISERFTSGFPDLILIKSYHNFSRIIFIEVKFEKNPLTKLQEYTLKELSKYGAESLVIRYLNGESIVQRFHFGTALPAVPFGEYEW